MNLLKVWLENLQKSWAKPSNIYIEEEFEILEFDHIPFIDETFKYHQQRTIKSHFPKAS